MYLCLFVHLVVCLQGRKHRLTKIREYRWAVGQLNSEDVLSLMSKGEIKFYQDYDQLLGTYMQNSGFDLTAVLFNPACNLEYVSSSFIVCRGGRFTRLWRDRNSFRTCEYILGSLEESCLTPLRKE